MKPAFFARAFITAFGDGVVSTTCGSALTRTAIGVEVAVAPPLSVTTAVKL